MIILITGPTHAGKTKLAQSFLEKYKYPYLSIDHLKMGLIRSGNTALTAEDDSALTDYLWPIVCEIIKTVIENHQNLTIEGCYIPFEWQKDLDARYLPSIRYICLAMTDEYIEKHFEEIKEHSRDIEARLDDSFCTVALLQQDNRRYIDGCRQCGNPVTIIDRDYERVVEQILEMGI